VTSESIFRHEVIAAVSDRAIVVSARWRIADFVLMKLSRSCELQMAAVTVRVCWKHGGSRHANDAVRMCEKTRDSGRVLVLVDEKERYHFGIEKQ
jgi:hypothetical protein